MTRVRAALAILALTLGVATPLAWEGVASAGPTSWHLTKVIGPASVGEMTSVDCVSITNCLATNYGGYLYATTNDWATVHRVEGAGTHVADTMNAVTCMSATTCVAVGGWGTSTTGYGIVERTTNFGSTWVPEHLSTTTWPLYGVSCPTSTICYAAGARNGHEAYWMKSTNAGVTWTAHVGIDPSIGVLDAISCDGVSFCATTGSIATAANTDNGGTSWSDAVIPTYVKYFYGISCLLSTNCVAVGGSTSSRGLALSSVDGGLHWSAMVVPTSVKLLYGVTCLSTTNCFAVGRTGTSDYNGHGVVLHTTNGSTWTPMSLPGGSTALLAITCSPTRCTAVGTNSSEEAVVLTYS